MLIVMILLGPRGLMPPQLNMAQHQMMLRNQTPPNMAQQNHFQQVCCYMCFNLFTHWLHHNFM